MAVLMVMVVSCCSRPPEIGKQARLFSVSSWAPPATSRGDTIGPVEVWAGKTTVKPSIIQTTKYGVPRPRPSGMSGLNLDARTLTQRQIRSRSLLATFV